MLNFILLIICIVAIIYSANWLVEGASSLAKRLGISDLVIGLTIVAFGTSAPELTVNIFSAVNGATDLAVGNILGSNVSNILLILGVSSIIYPLNIKLNTKWKEIPFSLLGGVVLGVMANDRLIDLSEGINTISRIDGIILLLFFSIFLVYTFEMAKHQIDEEEDEIKLLSLWKAIAFIIVGLGGLLVGGRYLVIAAVQIAQTIGMSEKVIGLTIVAIGTSLPELATSVVAAMRKKTDIAIGNVVGSNVYNIFLVLGVTSIINPIPFDYSANFDLMMVVASSFLLFLATVIIPKNKLVLKEGILFLLLYIFYIIYSIIR